VSALAVLNDSDDLEALFDSIVAANAPSARAPAESGEKARATGSEATSDIVARIGQLTRTIHDSLRELGYDKKLEAAAATIPDARERLAYVATLTERAAIRVMNATDVARPIQDQLGKDATALAKRWQEVFAAKASVEEFKSLAQTTLAYLENVPKQTQATSAQLMEIVMAQDFQDLTGQVITRINELAHRLEQELLVLLLEHTPAEQRPKGADGLLNGPVINADRGGEVVTTQAQVDELLGSLGF
jgi:chemotaxis protein CheZ